MYSLSKEVNSIVNKLIQEKKKNIKAQDLLFDIAAGKKKIVLCSLCDEKGELFDSHMVLRTCPRCKGKRYKVRRGNEC